MTLTEFLLARIAEDEREVAVVTERDPILSGDRATWRGNFDDLDVRLSPARALAECEAKRRVVAEYERWSGQPGTDATATALGLRMALLHLALPYADHPDYHEEWKP